MPKDPHRVPAETLPAAASFAGQLGAYAEAVARATGKRAAGISAHLVAQGRWWR